MQAASHRGESAATFACAQAQNRQDSAWCRGNLAADMQSAGLCGRFHLPLSLPEPRFLRFAGLSVAAMATDAFLEFRSAPRLRRQRASASLAEFQPARNEAVTERDPLVEHEALALPGALGFRHLLQVFQDASPKVIDVFYALRDEVARGLLAADASGAEHRDPLAGEALPVLLPPGGKIPEGFRMRV